MRPSRVRSLRGRVLAAGLSVLAVAMVAASGTVMFWQAAALEQHLDDVLDERAAYTLDIAAYERDHEELASVLAARGIRAVVTDLDGARFVADPSVPRVGRNLPRPAGSEPPSLEFRTVELPIGGEVRVAVSRDGVDATLRRMLGLLLVTTLVAVPTAGLLLYRSAELALRPLAVLTDTANSIAEGDATQRIRDATPGTELGNVAAAFNRMLDELQSAADRARTSAQTTRIFLDAAAHQLQTPIAAASTSVQAMLLDPPEAARQQLALTAARETQRAGKVVTDLLSLARIDAGVALTPEAVDLAEVIDDEVQRAAHRTPRLRFEQLCSARTMARIDRAATCEVLANLLDNASRYSEERIEVRLTETGEFLRVEVGDDGPGVPHGDEERIFQRFVTARGSGGAGLGLPIARHLARLQGGDVWSAQGAFVLTLPREPGVRSAASERA
jgi:two-component system OmpR family sensor kinase